MFTEKNLKLLQETQTPRPFFGNVIFHPTLNLLGPFQWAEMLEVGNAPTTWQYFCEWINLILAEFWMHILFCFKLCIYFALDVWHLDRCTFSARHSQRWD